MKQCVPVLAGILALLSPTLLRADTEIGFIEKFALARDREQVLSQLIPGSEDYYYFHALHYENTRQKEKLSTTMREWAVRFPASERRKVIENREALLNYDTNPQATLEFLKRRLNLRFEHQQQARDQKPDLPTALDPAKIAREVFQRRALSDADHLGESTDQALETFVREKVPLSDAQRRALLARLTRPDLSGLLEVIEAELRTEESKGFGEYHIQRALLPEQLDALATRLSALYTNHRFVQTRLSKMAPSADVDLQFDLAAREAFLDRLWAYAKNLTPAFNTLKAHILRQRLELDRKRGVYDKERFLDYLKLPRRLSYVNPRYLQQPEHAQYPVDLNADPKEVLVISWPIGNDETLVREFFLQIFKDEPSWEPWAQYVRDSWLKPVFAEAKITHGVGEPTQWASLLSPEAFKALKERVDVDFAATNPEFLKPGDEVSVQLFVKNVPQLIVRTYEINTLSFYLTQKRELNTDLNLDGLVANAERTVSLTDDPAGRNPFRRVPRTFSFPELKGKRGAWVIEFIGGGLSSRALIRAGQFHLLQDTSATGELLTVLDETRKPVPNAAVWMDGRRYTPDEKAGKIVIPFTQRSGTKPVILADAAGTFASLAQLAHHEENYTLDARFHIEREQLLAGRQATLAIRAALLVGEKAAPLELLQELNLTLSATTLDGITTVREITPEQGLKLEATKDYTFAFRVPDRLAALSATLTGKVEKITKGGEKQEVVATCTWQLNGIDKTDPTNDGHLTRFGEDYAFELLGKTGEAVPDQQVVFEFQHRLFERPETIALRTDEKGRITLGPLREIRSIRTQIANGRSETWHLTSSTRTWTNERHAKAGEVIRIPWSGGDLNRATASLLETRAGSFVADHFGALSLANGFLEIKELEPGDYSLRMQTADGERPEIAVRITAGDLTDDWIVSENRHLETGESEPLQITAITTDEGGISVRLANTGPQTRLHVAVSRFVPKHSLFDSFGQFPPEHLREARPGKFPNLYAAGRNIGDEYRYILERRHSKLFPGNMLPRPGLLLNPWETRSTDLEEQTMAAMEAPPATAGGRAGAMPAPQSVKPKDATRESLPAHPRGENLDFLATAAPVIYNLVPDQNGVVRIDRAWLGDRQFVQILAEDLSDAVWHALALSEVPTKFWDMRLTRPLDPVKSFTETRKVTALHTGQTLTVADVNGADLETYDSLALVYGVFMALSNDANLAKFAFVVQWPKLSEEEKRAKYSEFACHELNFFLSRKDPQFFEKVVLPYLRNKKEKTFMDDFLLGNDLRPYLDLWTYGRLNMAERALLGQRLPSEAAAAALHLREVWELVPPDQEYLNWLFETALRGGGLTAGKDGSFRAAKAAEEPLASGLMESQMPARTGIAPFEGERATPPAEGERVLGQKMEGKMLRRGGTPILGRNIEELKRLREQIRPFYRRIGPTKEWAENNYYHVRISEQNADLVPINTFWRDFAAWDGKSPFLSGHFLETTRNFSEIMLALAALDLPFEAPKHQTRSENNQFTLTAAGPLLVFHKEMQVTQPAEGQGSLLLSENFFRQDDRYRMEGNEQFDKYVTDEFLTGVVYGGNVVVTNPSSSPQKVELLIQVPEGSVPVLGSKTTDSRRLQLGPYSTQRIEYFFYFPVPREEPFKHYPPHVSINGKAAGAAKPTTFKVVRQLSQIDTTSWEYLSQYGSDEEVFAFLEKNNILRLDLTRIAWRARRSADFFRRLITVLQARHKYDDVIYSYAVVHNDRPALTEWLKHQEAFLAEAGPYLKSPLLVIDPVERRAYEHLEYSPLVNQRRHRLGSENQIPNPAVRAQYQILMNILAHKPTLNAEDQMSVVYHLFLQDRIEEALAWFHAIQPESLPTRLQHDYFRCYAAFYEEQLAEARGIASQYAQYPVDRWRQVFTEVLTQLDEIEGKNVAPREGKVDGKPSREAQQGNFAATEPAFDFKVENRQIELTWRNLTEVTIHYYLMDPEFLFSSSPFVTEDPARFSIIKPVRSDRHELKPGESAVNIPLPGEFAKANVLVEILAAGQRKAQAYHANTLQLTLAENYGRIDVRDATSGRPVSKAYIKVYARLKNGQIRFYKDGYTDLRGKFDYASLNTGTGSPIPPPVRPLNSNTVSTGNLSHPMLTPAELGEVDKLAILVLSPVNGALVREARPPAE